MIGGLFFCTYSPRHHQMPAGGRVKRKAGKRTRREPWTKEVAANLEDLQSEMIGGLFFAIKTYLSHRRPLAATNSTVLNQSSISSKYSTPSPHPGHTQVGPSSLKGVPGGIPPSGSPRIGSYIHPQAVHSYFFIVHNICLT